MPSRKGSVTDGQTVIGEHHHKQRKMLNSVFAINHMRSLVPTFYGIVHKACCLYRRYGGVPWFNIHYSSRKPSQQRYKAGLAN